MSAHDDDMARLDAEIARRATRDNAESAAVTAPKKPRKRREKLDIAAELREERAYRDIIEARLADTMRRLAIAENKNEIVRMLLGDNDPD